ncbi:MAG TPA: Rieske (2Fe-2S) protein [Roseiflexaceae bacterium]|nr:Rieske (2Fe-2S) protein [Roseiflexaceae bacterium]
MARYIVATVEEIPPGGRKLVEIAGRSIGVFNLDGEFFALRNRCPHQGGPLCAGVLGGLISAPRPGEYQYSRAGEILRCPWHGWEFDIRTGQSWFDPARVRVRRYDVTVEAQQSTTADPLAQAGLERGPYIAETYVVAVEQRNVVVDVPA